MRDIGLTKSAAHNMKLKGYPFSYYSAINRARPNLPVGVEYIATPVQGEMTMLYSFKNPEDGKAFIDSFPEAQALSYAGS